MRIMFLAIFTSFFVHLRYSLAKAAVWSVIFHPVCITPVCLKLALGWISHGRATLSCNTWFHKSGMSQQVDSATRVRVDCDDTERSERSPQTIQKRLQGFLRLCQIRGNGHVWTRSAFRMCEKEEMLAVCQKWQSSSRVKGLTSRTRSSVNIKHAWFCDTRLWVSVYIRDCSDAAATTASSFHINWLKVTVILTRVSLCFFLFYSGAGSCFVIAMSSQTSYGSSVLCELLRSFRLSVFVLTNWCWLSVAFLFSFCFLTFSPVHKRRLECISGYSRRIVERVQLTAAWGFHKQQQHISCIPGTHVYSVFTFLFWPLVSNVWLLCFDL